MRCPEHTVSVMVVPFLWMDQPALEDFYYDPIHEMYMCEQGFMFKPEELAKIPENKPKLKVIPLRELRSPEEVHEVLKGAVIVRRPPDALMIMFYSPRRRMEHGLAKIEDVELLPSERTPGLVILKWKAKVPVMAIVNADAFRKLDKAFKRLEELDYMIDRLEKVFSYSRNITPEELKSIAARKAELERERESISKEIDRLADIAARRDYIEIMWSRRIPLHVLEDIEAFRAAVPKEVLAEVERHVAKDVVVRLAALTIGLAKLTPCVTSRLVEAAFRELWPTDYRRLAKHMRTYSSQAISTLAKYGFLEPAGTLKGEELYRANMELITKWEARQPLSPYRLPEIVKPIIEKIKPPKPEELPPGVKRLDYYVKKAEETYKNVMYQLLERGVKPPPPPGYTQQQWDEVIAAVLEAYITDSLAKKGKLPPKPPAITDEEWKEITRKVKAKRRGYYSILDFF